LNKITHLNFEIEIVVDENITELIIS